MKCPSRLLFAEGGKDWPFWEDNSFNECVVEMSPLVSVFRSSVERRVAILPDVNVPSYKVKTSVRNSVKDMLLKIPLATSIDYNKHWNCRRWVRGSMISIVIPQADVPAPAGPCI